MKLLHVENCVQLCKHHELEEMPRYFSAARQLTIEAYSSPCGEMRACYLEPRVGVDFLASLPMENVCRIVFSTIQLLHNV